jgi:hypothetical protein
MMKLQEKIERQRIHEQMEEKPRRLLPREPIFPDKAYMK